jgi:small subunit ribosomal protein S6
MVQQSCAVPLIPRSIGEVGSKTGPVISMKGYELFYIIGTQYTDDEIGGVQTKIASMLEEAGAKILKNENLGKIRLAYPIKKIRHGSYILVYFDAEGSVITDVNRRLGLADEVLRHTILERPKDALERTFELSSYIAPLSEEAKSERESKRETKRVTKRVPKKTSEPVIAPPTPAPSSMQESSMTMEELDKKLEKILEGDIAENI